MSTESALLEGSIKHSPIDTRLHPLVALKAVRRLIANPEDTAQVFVILKAMRGGSAKRVLLRFAASPVGSTVLREKRVLLKALSDDTALAALPEGSLGRTYKAFMDCENLSAAGLVESSQVTGPNELPPQVRLVRERMRDMHDLTHVVTGYGRDRLGELCLLAFMFAQNGNPGMAMIVIMTLLKQRSLAAWRAVIQAWRHGRKAAWLGGQDWETMLVQPLEELRRQLNIAAPTRYRPVAP